MITGYKRTPAKFDWCGTSVWLRQVTRAERKRILQANANAQEGIWAIDLVMLALCNEAGEPVFAAKDRDAAIEYFDNEVGEQDFVKLFELANENGWDGKAEVQKKS